MPVKLTRLGAALTVSGLVLIMQPAAALHRVHNNDRADGIAHSSATVPRPPVHYDDTPSYDDPSKFGGGSVPETLNPPAPAHVQPRGSAFNPNSAGVKAVQKRITDFDEMQRVQEESFDRKLIICRGC